MMLASDTLQVAVRALPTATVEGAFRVHVLPESLDQAGLKVGDVCEIASEDGIVGYGIAWRADDNMGNRPKNRPAKMTEMLRAAFGFQEGSKVTIRPTSIRISHADRIFLSDVSPRDYPRPQDIEDGLWRTRIKHLFSKCEALAIGITFDVQGKKKTHKKRFSIDNIESTTALADAPSLYFITDATRLITPGQVAESTSNFTTIAHDVPVAAGSNSNVDVANLSQPLLRTDRIGGIIQQIETLDKQIRIFLKHGSRVPIKSVLIHGYEGTGKSMLLDTVETSMAFRKVLRLDRPSLNGGTVSKNQAIIANTFKEASSEGPSLIIVDDLEELIPNDDIAYSRTLITEMERARDSPVMIIAATRAPANVKSAVIGSGHFELSIELPVPDLTAREQIINVLRQKPSAHRDELTTRLAAQTHGFTSRNLVTLYRLADNASYLRLEEQTRPPTYEVATQEESAARTSEPESGTPASPEITLADFEKVLPGIRPTALREMFFEKPKTRWDDIGGSGDVKDEFDRNIGRTLHGRNSISRFMWKPPKGVLLYGPPGCSKTLTAQAVANMYDFNFIAIKGAELISMYVGESERAVREVFRKARMAAPCVIFFDEIDAIGSDRNGRDGGSGSKGLNVLTTLLNEMDGFDALKDVFILAATNRPESLDPALLRPGRFDSHIYLGPPGAAARREILRIALRITAELPVPLAADVDLDELIAITEGYSGAEIVRFCQIAQQPAKDREDALRKHAQSNSSDEATTGDVILPWLNVEVTAAEFLEARTKVKRGISPEMLAGYEQFANDSRTM